MYSLSWNGKSWKWLFLEKNLRFIISIKFKKNFEIKNKYWLSFKIIKFTEYFVFFKTLQIDLTN